jgi:hypothetical protein
VTFTRADAGRAAARKHLPVREEGISATMTAVAHSYPFVIGVDTHARAHTCKVLAANGEHLAGAGARHWTGPENSGIARNFRTSREPGLWKSHRHTGRPVPRRC